MSTGRLENGLKEVESKQMKLDSLTPDDEKYLDDFIRRILDCLKSFKCGSGWRIRFADVFEEFPQGAGWTSTATKRMQFRLSALESPEHEVKRIVAHELAHVFCETHGLIPEGGDPHGEEFKTAFEQLRDCGIFSGERLARSTTL